MGAGAMTIQFIMIKEFVILILISLLIAIPAGWIIVGKLLEQFASRIDLKIIVFLIIAICALIIALVTVSFQAFMVSRINPAEALKIE
jgi:ABC-type antimicrobial peptide transport system permease subunit